MTRPENVDDALRCGQSGIYAGHYGPYILHSAYQPIVSLRYGQPVLHGVEALLRPALDDQWLAPLDFFQLVDPEDRFFVEWMCRALHMRNFKASSLGNMDLFINLDPSLYSDLYKTRFELQVMVEKMNAIDLGTDLFVCEIIETKAASKIILAEIVETLRAHGVRVAIDDFGSHHSDFERLRELNPDYVKLDRAWTKRHLAEPSTRCLLGSIVDKFAIDGIQVIFEGVDNPDMLRFAQECGAEAAQGFLFGYPKVVPTNFDDFEPDIHGLAAAPQPSYFRIPA